MWQRNTSSSVVLCTDSEPTVTPDAAASSISAIVVAGPLAVAIRKMFSSAVTELHPRQPLEIRSRQSGGALAKLTSSEFLPGIDALSLSGESSALSSPWSTIGDTVAELVGLVHVVRRDQDRQVALALDLGEHLPDRDPRHRIETGGRLVEKEDARLVDQAAGDFDAPPHAARQVLHLRLAPLRQLDRLEQLVDQPLRAWRAARCTAWRR